MRLLMLGILSMWPAVHSYHILCIFSMPSRSHSILGKGVVDSLLKAGHKVTWATPYPPKNPVNDLTIIDISDVLSTIVDIDMTQIKSISSKVDTLLTNVRNISEITLNPTLQRTLVDTQFDAVVTELFFNEFDSGYAAIQGIPWIALSGTVLQPIIQTKIDEVNTVPTIPLMFTDFTIPMNIWERFATAGIFAGMTTISWMAESSNEDLYKSLFNDLASRRGVVLPPYAAAANNMSILFLNSHSSYTDAISLPPNVVEVAGFHLEETAPPLPKDLQDIMDASPQGVIYFSMGSVVKSTAIPEQAREEFIKIFASLPYTVLWKFDQEIENLPSNVHVRKWLPQYSILAHPNVRVFITHGGMLSQIEALSAGVTLISIPVFGDQAANACRAERLGFSIALTFDVDTLPQQFEKALMEILDNEKYHNRAKELSSMFHKRPVSPSKLISHYIELAIETKGAVHLRSKSLQYSWYQRWMLDVLLILLVTFTILYKLIKASILFFISKFKGSPNKKKIN